MKYELELSSLGCRENIFCIVGIKDKAVKRENLQATLNQHLSKKKLQFLHISQRLLVPR